MLSIYKSDNNSDNLKNKNGQIFKAKKKNNYISLGGFALSAGVSFGTSD